MNNVSLAVSLPTAPSSAFVELRERPRFWFPLLIMIACTSAVSYWYYSAVDVDWLKDVLFTNNAHMTGEERAAAMGMMTRTTLLWSSVVGTLIFVPLFTLIQAFLLWIAAKVTKSPIGFKHWFSMASWTSLTGLLGIVVSAIFLLLSDTPQISPGSMAPLSLNELLLHLPAGSPGQNMLDFLGIPLFLSWALMIVGVHTWSQRSWQFSASFVLVPVAVVFGLWALLAFR